MSANDNTVELPTVTVYPKDREVLHIIGYMREHSTLTTYTDTVSLYREKKVDFMLPCKKGKKFKGWTIPRLLASRSYYQFTDASGLDSVSDECAVHFSWSDWLEMPVKIPLRERLQQSEWITDTLRGVFHPSQIWRREGEHLFVDVNLLSDTLNYRWLKQFALSYMGKVDFEHLRLQYEYDEVTDSLIRPEQLTKCTFHISSEGRGYDMSSMFRNKGPVYIETRGELYLTEKEYISVKEAQRRSKESYLSQAGELIMPDEAGLPPANMQILVARVDKVDKALVRRAIVPDQRLAGIKDLFSTRRSAWRKFMDMISPQRYNMNVSAFPSR